MYVVTDKSPKWFRFTLVTRMQNLTIDAVEQPFIQTHGICINACIAFRYRSELVATWCKIFT